MFNSQKYVIFLKIPHAKMKNNQNDRTNMKSNLENRHFRLDRLYIIVPRKTFPLSEDRHFG